MYICISISAQTQSNFFPQNHKKYQDLVFFLTVYKIQIIITLFPSRTHAVTCRYLCCGPLHLFARDISDGVSHLCCFLHAHSYTHALIRQSAITHKKYSCSTYKIKHRTPRTKSAPLFHVVHQYLICLFTVRGAGRSASSLVFLSTEVSHLTHTHTHARKVFLFALLLLFCLSPSPAS